MNMAHGYLTKISNWSLQHGTLYYQFCYHYYSLHNRLSTKLEHQGQEWNLKPLIHKLKDHIGVLFFFKVPSIIGLLDIPIDCTIDFLQCRKTSKGNGNQTSYTCILILIQNTELRPLERYPLSLFLLFIQNSIPSILVNTWILNFEASKNKIR